MAFTKIFLCLAAGGCVVGAAVGTSYSSMSARDRFLYRLKYEKDCTRAYFMINEDEKFGTVYTCEDGFLWYLENEEFFEWSKSFDELMPLFKKIESFKFTKGDKPYLTFDLKDDKGERQIFVEPSVSNEESWNIYRGFSHN